MRKSGTIAEIAKALTAVQKAIDPVKKTKTADAGTYTYNYADLETVVDSARALLAENGLAVFQETESRNGECGVTTLLLHSSGEWIEAGPLFLPAGKTAQSFGSAITYARRYSFSSALGITAEEDDDGRAASDSKSSKSRKGATGGQGPSAAKQDGSALSVARSNVVSTATGEGIESATAKRLLAGWFQGVSASKDLDEMQCKAAIDGFQNYGKTLREITELAAGTYSDEEVLLIASAERTDPYTSLQELSLDELRGVRDELRLAKAGAKS